MKRWKIFYVLHPQQHEFIITATLGKQAINTTSKLLLSTVSKHILGKLYHKKIQALMDAHKEVGQSRKNKVYAYHILISHYQTARQNHNLKMCHGSSKNVSSSNIWEQ
jgi:uncharacterized protein YpiB (UPF0302 family)